MKKCTREHCNGDIIEGKCLLCGRRPMERKSDECPKLIGVSNKKVVPERPNSDRIMTLKELVCLNCTEDVCYEMGER